MTFQSRFLTLVSELQDSIEPEFQAADKKIQESVMGKVGTATLGLLIGAMISEFGAEETDRLLVMFVVGINELSKK